MGSAQGAAELEKKMINGTNASGKLFDVVDEDGKVLGSFDHISDAVACGQAAPWYAGKVNICRDRTITAATHSRTMSLAAANRAAMDFGPL